METDGGDRFDLTGEIMIRGRAPEFIGSYSVVYRGQWAENTVAVKIIRSVGALSTMRRKVRRERMVWESLEHLNILPFYGHADDEEFQPFGAFISPWCLNGDVGQFLEQYGGEMDTAARVILWMGVLNGVAFLHSRNPIIVHGDLKPGNILIDDNRNPRISDFGLSRIIQEGGTGGMTTTTEHTGTERYLAPELVTDNLPTPTTESDVYALGCLGLEFLYLERPYAHRYNNHHGCIITDIRGGIPPANRQNDVHSPMGAWWGTLRSWNLLEAFWSPDPVGRPAAAFVVGFLAASNDNPDNAHKTRGAPIRHYETPAESRDQSTLYHSYQFGGDEGVSSQQYAQDAYQHRVSQIKKQYDLFFPPSPAREQNFNILLNCDKTSISSEAWQQTRGPGQIVGATANFISKYSDAGSNQQSGASEATGDVMIDSISEDSDQYKASSMSGNNSNGAVEGSQAPQGAHQMSQQHQSMRQNMSLMGNQALTAQMQRQVPRMPHTVMNNQNQHHQQQHPQQYQLQFTQNNLIGNMGINHNTSAAAAQFMPGRQNSPIFPPSTTNISPAVALQLQKINNGIASGQAQLQRASGSSQGNSLQLSSSNYAQFEHRMNTIQEQGKLAVQSGNTMQIRQARDAAAEVQKKSNEERERWVAVVQQVRANGIKNNTAKQVELWFARYQKLYERADLIVKSLETAVQSIQQQQQQAQQQQAQQAQRQQLNMAPPPFSIGEIIRLHEHCQKIWRQTYDTLPLPTFPLPNNIQVWKDRYRQAMQEMKPIIMAMGLYLHMRREQKEMLEIIQKSVLLMKQKQLMGTHVLLTIQGLEDIIKFFHLLMLDLQERIGRLRALGTLPPALHALINPSDTDFVTLGGLLPAPPSASTPSHPQTPAAGRMTPATTAPTPAPATLKHPFDETTLLTDLGSLIPMANEPDSEVEGADIEFFDYTAYLDIEAMAVPELDQRTTPSFEPTDYTTTTPPSETNVPARPGPNATEQKAAGTGAPLATAGKVEDVQIGTMNASDYMDPFGNAEFFYDGTVEQLDEPWAIA